MSAEERLGRRRRGRTSLWEAERDPVGMHFPWRMGDQRILHSALMTRMRGLGVDSPRGSKWVHTERQLLQPQRSPRWLWRNVSSPGSAALLGFSNRRAVLMSLVVVFTGPGPHPAALICECIFNTSPNCGPGPCVCPAAQLSALLHVHTRQ